MGERVHSATHGGKFVSIFLPALLLLGALAPVANKFVNPVYVEICRRLNEGTNQSAPAMIGPFRWNSDRFVYLYLIQPAPLVGTILFTLSLITFALLTAANPRIRIFYSLWFVFFLSGIFLLCQLSLIYFFFAAISLAFLARIREWHFLKSQRFSIHP